MPLHPARNMPRTSTTHWCLLVFFVGIVTINGCEPWDWSFDEVARATNPSGKVDAVLVERNGGATTSFGYNIYVVPKGKSVTKRDAEVVRLYGAVRSEDAYGVNLKWDAPNTLRAEYLRAQNSEVLKDVVGIADEQISVTLRPNITDPLAPSGGMLYNLEKRR